MRLFLVQLLALALLVAFFVSVHELGAPRAGCREDLCRAASTSTLRHPYCHALPIPFFRPLDEDYFDVWPEFGCARDLVPDDYPEGICGRPGAEFMCAPSPLAPLKLNDP